MSKKTHIITLRVSDEMAKKIAEAVRLSGRDQAALLRDAVDLGFDDLFLIGLDPLAVAKEKIKAIKEQLVAPLKPAPVKANSRSAFGGGNSDSIGQRDPGHVKKPNRQSRSTRS